MLRILRICPIHKVSDFKYSPVLSNIGTHPYKQPEYYVYVLGDLFNMEAG